MANFEIWVPDDDPNIDHLYDWLITFLNEDCEFEEYEVVRVRR